PTILTQKCVHIVVLGDLVRSPRMCNHAIEFDKHKFIVQLIGYAGWSLEYMFPAKKSIYLRKNKELILNEE
ncbi:unnamed protein product, partial [Rotaria sp. Silwood1]